MKKYNRIVALTLLAFASATYTTAGPNKRSLSSESIGGSAPYRDAVQRYLKNVEPKIVGGRPAQPGAFPWQVSLSVSWIAEAERAHFCGGTVYSDSWIVTAAHCVEDTAARDLVVVAGTNKLGMGGTRHNVERIIVNKDYNKATSDNDIALLQLRQPLSLNNNVKAIPLATSGTEGNLLKKDSPLVVTGWGATTEGGHSVRDLRFVEVPYVERDTCNRPLAYDGRITKNMICAGVDAGGKDSCQGDSGGPLTANTGSATTLVGVVSWGEGCAQPNRVGVYTRVANYADWVKGCASDPEKCE
jgi:secreted trypsin-like serine protease